MKSTAANPLNEQFATNVVGNLEEQLPLPPAGVDFSQSINFINTSNDLELYKTELLQRIQHEIQAPIDALLAQNAMSSDNLIALDNKLLSLLEVIAPKIAIYNGEGLSKEQFTTNAFPFLDFFGHAQIGGGPGCPTELETRLAGNCLMIFFSGGLGTAIVGIMRLAKYDDQAGEIMCPLGLFIAIIMLYIFCRWKQNDERARAHEAHRDRVLAALDDIFSDYCYPRYTPNDFTNGSCVPRCFRELAAKLCVSNIVILSNRAYKYNYEKIDAVLQSFRQNNTFLEAREFQRLLEQTSCDEMVVCVHDLLAIKFTGKISIPLESPQDMSVAIDRSGHAWKEWPVEEESNNAVPIGSVNLGESSNSVIVISSAHFGSSASDYPNVVTAYAELKN